MKCRNPRCEQAAAPGEKWCMPHADVLARVRGELEADMQRLRKGKAFSIRCREAGCPENRARGSFFCVEHQHLEVE